MVLCERRLYGRVPFTKRLTIVDVTGKSEPVEANGIDMNVAGVAFYSEKHFEPESRIRIHVWLGESCEDNVQINATVVWARPEQNGSIMGARFDKILMPMEYPDFCELIDAK